MTVTFIGCTIPMLTENILSTSTTPLLVVLKVTQDEGEELLRVSIFDDGLLKSVLSEIVNIILNQTHTNGIPYPPYPIFKTLWQTLH